MSVTGKAITLQKVVVFRIRHFRGDSASGPTDTLWFTTQMKAMTHAIAHFIEDQPCGAEADCDLATKTYYVDGKEISILA
jgi:hypothetical protein